MRIEELNLDTNKKYKCKVELVHYFRGGRVTVVEGLLVYSTIYHPSYDDGELGWFLLNNEGLKGDKCEAMSDYDYECSWCMAPSEYISVEILSEVKRESFKGNILKFHFV